MHRSNCFILWHRSCKILKSMICYESETKKIDSKRHGTCIVAKYMRYSTRPTWIISYASLYFEFETLYSTDVSLMYIRANASVSWACMCIRRSTNINAQIRNTSRLSSSTKCRNRSSIEHVQCTRRTVSRDEKKKHAPHLWRTKLVKEGTYARNWTITEAYAPFSHHNCCITHWSASFVDRTISSARVASHFFRIVLHALHDLLCST